MNLHKCVNVKQAGTKIRLAHLVPVLSIDIGLRSNMLYGICEDCSLFQRERMEVNTNLEIQQNDGCYWYLTVTLLLQHILFVKENRKHFTNITKKVFVRKLI